MKKKFRISVIVATLVVAMLGVSFEVGARGKVLVNLGKAIVKPPKVKIPDVVKIGIQGAIGIGDVKPLVQDIKPLECPRLPSNGDLLVKWTVKELLDTTNVRLTEMPQLLPVVDVCSSAQKQCLLPMVPQLAPLSPVVWIRKRPRSMEK